MNEIIPIFYDSSSFKSILTVAEHKEPFIKNGPTSIVSLALKAGLKKCVFVSKNFYSFLDLKKNLKKQNIELVFGLELIMCDDAKTHTPESQRNEHKIIILLKNPQGYKDLLKIYTTCYIDADNKYYIQRFDYKQLKPLWTDNLIMALPFFDSFLAKNCMVYDAAIIPDLSFTKPVILKEINSGLPFEPLINKSVDNYNNTEKLSVISCKTIYYENKEDFRAYSVYRAIMNKSSHQCPDMDHFGSQNFSFEDWRKLTC